MADLESSGQGGSSSPSAAEKSPVRRIKWLALGGVVIGLAVLSTVGLGKSLQEFLKKHWSDVLLWKEENPCLLGGGFFLAYVAAVGLSLPIAVPLSLAAGALY